jgi:hypothetical protein
MRSGKRASGERSDEENGDWIDEQMNVGLGGLY